MMTAGMKNSAMAASADTTNRTHKYPRRGCIAMNIQRRSVVTLRQCAHDCTGWPQKKTPVPQRGTGTVNHFFQLVRCEVLMIAQVHDVLELRRRRRQVRRIQEQHVE